ncbi:MAG TPA: GNAT family N-acetyltransferase [Candidatus Dormibacteraeota bacterium]
MAKAQTALELRPATIADAARVADLETARTPDEPRDPEMLLFRWVFPPAGEVFTRMLAERDGSAIAFLQAGHRPWNENAERFGPMRFILHPNSWADVYYEQLVDAGEAWARAEGAEIGVVRVRETIKNEIRILQRRGYREVRRGRQWELDLSAHRERLLAGAEEGRERMRQQGVRVMTLDRDTDPDRLAKLYEMSTMGERDIPTTVPMHSMSYDEWHHLWFDNPGTRTDRFWIAREGDAIVGLSAIEYPPTRGVPWTAFTTTARSVRGRGIARALKYETIAQAIALGVERIRTQNDGENAPILHLNAQMGYVPIDPVIELHRELNR